MRERLQHFFIRKIFTAASSRIIHLSQSTISFSLVFKLFFIHETSRVFNKIFLENFFLSKKFNFFGFFPIFYFIFFGFFIKCPPPAKTLHESENPATPGSTCFSFDSLLLRIIFFGVIATLSLAQKWIFFGYEPDVH